MHTGIFVRCIVCETTVEVHHGAAFGVTCCGREMLPVGGKMGGEGAFRHLPVFARGEQGCRVTVGRQVHVATEQHHIRWIEVSGPAGRQRTYFRPGQLPQVVLGPEWEGPLVAKVYCSQHGLWSGSEASGAALVEAAAAALAAESTCGHCHEA